MSKLIQLKKDGISERIKKPRTAPVIGTAAKIEEAFAVPIDLAAKAVGKIQKLLVQQFNFFC